MVIGFGIGFGMASLATPQLLADRYGTTAYASIAGTLAAPVTLTKATGPPPPQPSRPRAASRPC
ncbi:MAG TPA: hypothetical protein VFG35_21055 [Actinoplanes sp.]|nr:hypothetical protein [Actinoplanes sp.]